MNMSKKAYHEYKEQFKTIRESIYQIINDSEHGISTDEIFSFTNLKMHTISGRLSELEDSGRIYVSGDNGKFSIWSVTPHDQIEIKKKIRYNLKKYLWMKSGVENGYISNHVANLINRIKD